MYSKYLTMYILVIIMTAKEDVTMTQVNFRVEDDVKLNAEKALKDMGLSMSTAINMFLVKVVREKRIPFEINADPFYSEANMRYLDKVISGIESGKAKLEEHELIEAD